MKLFKGILKLILLLSSPLLVVLPIYLSSIGLIHWIFAAYIAGCILLMLSIFVAFNMIKLDNPK